MRQEVKIIEESNGLIYPEGIDLADSFILEWHKAQDEFLVSLEFSIWPSSPYYQKPPPEYFTCYKKGVLRFHGLKNIKGYVDLETVRPSLDPEGTKDWDGIYDLRKENNAFKFSTDFTDIEIVCDGIEAFLVDGAVSDNERIPRRIL